MACLVMLRKVGPISLVASEVSPVTVEAYEFKMEGVVIGVIPKNVVLDALSCDEAKFNKMVSICGDIRERPERA